MHALLLIAHGSRRKASNDEVRKLSEKISKKNKGEFDMLECSFLELAEPLIPDAIDLLINKGAKKITIFPYFLAVGLHVAEDIPEEINKAKKLYPNVIFNTLPHLGVIEEMPNLILSQFHKN